MNKIMKTLIGLTMIGTLNVNCDDTISFPILTITNNTKEPGYITVEPIIPNESIHEMLNREPNYIIDKHLKSKESFSKTLPQGKYEIRFSTQFTQQTMRVNLLKHQETTIKFSANIYYK